MPLSPGDHLGPYEILAKIGEGGMGEVYRARDRRLDRDVALKILPAVVSQDPERLARLEREAKTLAHLNHQHIAQIYDTGKTDAGVAFLAMEFVAGDELAARVRRGPIPVAESIDLARQIAEALDVAHEAGIVHRDLKPANVKVRDDGVVKVLDFGLAKAAGVGGGDAAAADLATRTSPAITQPGLILGTAAYMAPEQARGKPIDKRADIWAFGVVLFEMLTGRRLFDGETISDVVAAVLTRPIDVGDLPADTPPRVRELVARCLERDPKRRLRDIGEARIALDARSDSPQISGSRVAASQPVAIAPVHSSPRARSSALPWIIAATALVIAGLSIGRVFSSKPASTSSAKYLLEIGPPPEGDFVVAPNVGAIIISPDASTVAFLAATDAGPKLFVRNLATGATRALPGTELASYPFWSPDSKKIGFFGASKLLTIAIAGGRPEAIADISQGRGGAWTDAGVILFTPIGGGTVHRVSERGGPVENVTTLDPKRADNAHYFPTALPGGKKFLFFVRSTVAENNGIYLGSVDGKAPPTRVMSSLSSGLYVPPQAGEELGHLLWVRDSELLSQSFDVDTGALSGDVATVATDVRVEESQRMIFGSASDNGTIVWASARAADYQFGSFDRTGARLGTLPIPPGKTIQPAISPDGRALAYTRVVSGAADVMQLDFASRQITPITTDPDYDEIGLWAPDGRSIVHQGRDAGIVSLVLSTVDGSKPRVVLRHGPKINSMGFLPDGKAVIALLNNKDLVLIRLSNPDAPIPIASDSMLKNAGAVSSNGQWFAYVGQQADQPQLYVAQLLDDGAAMRLGPRHQVSTDGALGVSWSKDDKELLFLRHNQTMTAVPVSASGATIAFGTPTALFNVSPIVASIGAGWAANAEHTKFVLIEAPLAEHQRFKIMSGWK